GFDAWGLSTGAAAALIIADLCESRENVWAGTFDASRHSLTGLGKRVANAGKLAGGLVGDHLRGSPERTPDEDREGEIVDVGGRAAGVFRAEDGTMRAVSAVCTHMGCKLGWNPVDRTWDCSCHGSRFACDGRVAHGPAVKPLAPIHGFER
ncbi:MAG: Rieske 2Fe-2S domain-containing protein, partial [Sphingomicrobium sp.]